MCIIIVSGCQSQQYNEPFDASAKSSDVNVRQPDVIYVDVRTAQERKQGHISWAIHLPLADIEKGHIDILPKDRSLIIYCRSGNRSRQAIEILQSYGFTRLTNGGGINDIEWAPIIEE